MSTVTTALPKVVSPGEWQQARQALLAKEKEATRALDALAAERRRLPMVAVEKEYVFQGANGEVRLLDLFDGRRQLAVYHFMFAPEWEVGCVGCSMLTDSFGHLAHLNARDTSFVMISRAPFEKLEQFRRRMGWSVPWYSSYGSDFNYDFGASSDRGENSVMSVLLRDGDRAFLTYQTTSRGLDRFNLVFNVLVLTPYGRQESWEDSPDGWPQTDPYVWWRLHDEYGA